MTQQQLKKTKKQKKTKKKQQQKTLCINQGPVANSSIAEYEY